MLLKCYPLLSTRSRRAINRVKRRNKIYTYKPRGTLLKRLAKDLSMSLEAVYQQLLKEREYLIKISK